MVVDWAVAIVAVAFVVLVGYLVPTLIQIRKTVAEAEQLLGEMRETTQALNAMVERRCANVDHWKTSNQKHRWMAAALLDIEPRLRRIRGYQHLRKLRQALKHELNRGTRTLEQEAA